MMRKSPRRIAAGTPDSVPDHWINLAPQMPWPLPLPIDEAGRDVSRDDLARLYSHECARVEVLEGEYGTESEIPIPESVLAEYARYRPTPFRRAAGLERRLGYRGRIYFKREDGNPTGSHKPNTAIVQAYWAARQGLRGLVTDTGAGQWGTALAWACRRFGIECTVFMTRNSYASKPYRRHMMALSGARVIASPSEETSVGRRLLTEAADHPGSLGIGMSEAMEMVSRSPDVRLALGCMSYYAALHQTVIGKELERQMRRERIRPDVLIGCVGGGTNFMGFVAPFVLRAVRRGRGKRSPRFVAVESASIPVLTQGRYECEHADAAGLTPKVRMYTLGKEFVPEAIHAGGLRYHGKSPILSLLVHKGIVEPVAIPEDEAFRAGRMFFESEGILPAPESSHAIALVVREAERAGGRGRSRTLVFCLSGTGYLDLEGYRSVLLG